MTTITSNEARYLKHSGKEIDVKVSIGIVKGQPVIWICDSEFWTVGAALTCLRHISESVCTLMDGESREGN